MTVRSCRRAGVPRLHPMAGRRSSHEHPHHRIDQRPAGIAAAEWEARVDLAAVYRLVAHTAGTT